MPRDLVWIRSPTEDLHFGGLRPSTEPMFTSASRCNLIWLASSCTEKSQRLRFHWFRYLEHIFGKRSMRVSLWTCVRYSTCNLRAYKLIQCKNRRFIQEKVIRWTLHVPISYFSQLTSGKSVNHASFMKTKKIMTGLHQINIGSTFN